MHLTQTNKYLKTDNTKKSFCQGMEQTRKHSKYSVGI